MFLGSDYDADWLMPHQGPAWQVMIERLNELAEFAASCRDECPPGIVKELAALTDRLRSQADRLAASA